MIAGIATNAPCLCGFGWIDVPEQEITTLEDPEGTGLYYDYGDLAIALAAGYRLTDRLAVGAALQVPQ